MNEQRRVARGVKLLDEQVPGWDERIRLGSLDMADGTKCVLGQLYGEYPRAVDVLFGSKYGGLLFSTGYRYGFNTYFAYKFGPLDREWTRVILERRFAAARRLAEDAEAMNLLINTEWLARAEKDLVDA